MSASCVAACPLGIAPKAKTAVQEHIAANTGVSTPASG